MRTSYTASEVWNKFRGRLLIWDVISEPGEWHNHFCSREVFWQLLTVWVELQTLSSMLPLASSVHEFDTRQNSSKLLMWTAKPNLKWGLQKMVQWDAMDIGIGDRNTCCGHLCLTLVCGDALPIPGRDISNLWLKPFHSFSAKKSQLYLVLSSLF